MHWQLTPPSSDDDFERFVEEVRYKRTPRLVRIAVECFLDAKKTFWDFQPYAGFNRTWERAFFCCFVIPIIPILAVVSTAYETLCDMVRTHND